MQEGQYESSVPVIADRALQACVASALEPEWEARFEPRSYGFRPGRGCHDAIEAIYQAGKGRNGASPRRMWVLDADLAAAFDRIDHDHLLSQLGTFPARDLTAGWLKAGVVEDGPVRPHRGGHSARRGDHAPNTMGNFCFEVTLSYRRLERPRRVPAGE